MKINLDNPIKRSKAISFETEQIKESLLLNSFCKREIKKKVKRCKHKFISFITSDCLYFVPIKK